MLLSLTACVPQLARAFLGRTPILNIFYNVNIAIEFFLLFAFFKDTFKTRTANRLYMALAIVSILAGVFSIAAFGIREKFLTEWLCINNLVYAAWILILVFNMYEVDTDLWEAAPSLLCYVFGLFFYATCTMLIFALWHYIMAHRNSYLWNLWIIHDAFNIIMYLSFLCGFVIEFRRYVKHKTTKGRCRIR